MEGVELLAEYFSLYLLNRGVNLQSSFLIPSDPYE